MSTSTSVPVGITTKVGWGSAALAFGGAVITYLTGNQSAQELTAVEMAGGGLIALGITQVGRYVQAHKQIGTALQTVSGVATELEPLLGSVNGPSFIHTTLADLEGLAQHAAQHAIAGISRNGEGIKTAGATGTVEPSSSPPEAAIAPAANDPAPATPVAGQVADAGAAPTQ